MNDLLAECGEALYGPRWQSDLARDLAVSIRTVQRWAVDGDGMPQGVYADLRRLMRERATLLTALAKRLPEAVPAG